MTNTYLIAKDEKAGMLTSLASLFTSLIAGLACIGPMLGIVLGVSGLGWLSSYSYLTLPASVASIVLLVVALYMFNKRKASCASRRKHMFNFIFMGITTAVVIGINVFEYLIFPNLI